MKTVAASEARAPRYYARRLAAAALDFLLMIIAVALIAIAVAQVVSPDRLRFHGGALNLTYCEDKAQVDTDGTGRASHLCDIRPLGLSIGAFDLRRSKLQQDGTTTKLTASIPVDAQGRPVEAAEIGWLVFIALTLTLWPWWEAGGGTPGKRALGLRVAQADGTAPALYWRTLLRTAIKFVPLWVALILPPVLGAVGLAPVRAALFSGVVAALLAIWFWVFFAGAPFGARRGPHDRWAGTRVILKGA